MSTVFWYQQKMGELKDNREFLREYISLLEAEIDILSRWNDDLANALIVTQQDDRGKQI